MRTECMDWRQWHQSAYSPRVQPVPEPALLHALSDQSLMEPPKLLSRKDAEWMKQMT